MSTSLLFFLAVALSVTSLILLALPLLAVANEAVGPRSPRADVVVAPPWDVVAPGESSRREGEQSVRGRVYGGRPNILITPVPRIAGPGLDSGRGTADPPDAIQHRALEAGR